MEEKARFCVGDKVFAKVRGYPAWPGKIEGFVNKTPFRVRYDVCFYGTGETSVVRDQDVYSFLENKHSMGKPKRNKNFDKAMADIMADLTPAERKYLAKVEEEYECREEIEDNSDESSQSDSNDSDEPISPNDDRNLEQDSSLGEAEANKELPTTSTSDQQAPAQFRTPLSGKMHPSHAFRPPLSAQSQHILGRHQLQRMPGKLRPPRYFVQRPHFSGPRPFYRPHRPPLPGQRPIYSVRRHPIPDRHPAFPGQGSSHPPYGYLPYPLFLPPPLGEYQPPPGQHPLHSVELQHTPDERPPVPAEDDSHLPFVVDPPPTAEDQPPPPQNPPNDKSTPQDQQQHPDNPPTSVQRPPVKINDRLASNSKKEDGQYLVASVNNTEVKIPMHFNKPRFLDSSDQKNWENHVRLHAIFVIKRLKEGSTFNVPIDEHMDKWTKEQAEKWNKKTEDRLKADSNRRFDLLQVEQNLIELYMGLRKALDTDALDTSKCIESLNKIKNLQLTPIMLKKNPRIVVVINSVRGFTGPKSKKKIDKVAETIREKADYLFEIFQKLFEWPEEREFLDYFMEEAEKFKNKTSGMTLEEITRLTSEPSYEVTEKPSSPPRKKMKKSKKKSCPIQVPARRLRSSSQ